MTGDYVRCFTHTRPHVPFKNIFLCFNLCFATSIFRFETKETSLSKWLLFNIICWWQLHVLCNVLFNNFSGKRMCCCTFCVYNTDMYMHVFYHINVRKFRQNVLLANRHTGKLTYWYIYKLVLSYRYDYSGIDILVLTYWYWHTGIDILVLTYWYWHTGIDTLVLTYWYWDTGNDICRKGSSFLEL